MTTPSLAHGALEQVTGKVKETVGKVIKNSGMRVDGIAQNAVGKAEIKGAKQLHGDQPPAENGAGSDAEDQRMAAAQEKDQPNTS
ncbi:hypothetical protein BDZ88DRAFT_507421 [Geranomyces variabilis]|nr:hypothetical protein BDZ88DRAFT_507421 [Geranomyces variabilis]KAJ3138112.1 hypothetical protein HDU90_001591 [Geranomyces variabilis]